MRRLILAATALLSVTAIFMIRRTTGKVPTPTAAEATATAPSPARVVDSTTRLLAPAERPPGVTTPVRAERGPSDTNEERFRAVRQAIVSTAPEAARLYADFVKAGFATPPQARTLVEMKQQGASHDDLVAYVRTSFPNDVIARAVALRWLGAGSAAHPSADTRPPSKLGDLVRDEAN